MDKMELSERASKVMVLAKEEAWRLGHNFIGTEQILLGILAEGTGIASNVLRGMGVTLKDARIEAEKLIGRGSGFCTEEVPRTPRALEAMELSADEAKQFGCKDIGDEQLLLGLIREGEGVALRVLENLGVDLANLRSHVIRSMGDPQASKESERPRNDSSSDKCLKCRYMAHSGVCPIDPRSNWLFRQPTIE